MEVQKVEDWTDHQIPEEPRYRSSSFVRLTPCLDVDLKFRDS